MNRLKTFTNTAVIAAGICIAAHSQLYAQDDDYPMPDPPDINIERAVPPTSPDAESLPKGVAIVDYSVAQEGTSGQQVTIPTVGGEAEKLPGLDPDQTVHITQQFEMTKVGHTIEAVALDGGNILNVENDLVVDENGMIDFDFQVGSESGLYQVALRDGSDEIGLQFWVINNEAPPDETPALDLPANP